MTQYKYNEKELIDALQTYVDSTYKQHYATSKIQTMETVIDLGDGVGFCRGAIMKYLQRYGKKNGYNRSDLMKVLHYALILLYVHDQYNEEKLDEDKLQNIDDPKKLCNDKHKSPN